MTEEPSWDDYAESWDDDEDVRRYSDLAFQSLTEHVLPGLTTRQRALDFGCGTGLLTTKLSELFAQVVALDVSPKMVEALDAKLAEITNVVSAVADIEAGLEHAELRDGSFDLIVASSVCAFLKNFDDALTTLTRLLRPEGLFVQWDWRAATDGEFGFTTERIRTSYAAAGLRATRVETAFALDGKDGTPMEVIMGVGRRA